ncbi:MAG TPA: hypothetical protein VHI78_11275 [Bacteroidales bacterium]|jgi:hypothetical protein|nr:hypothetical protein [Bacteroidales bacterium]
MKNLFLLLSFVLLAVSCSKEKNEIELTQDVLFQMIVSTPWQINLFIDDDIIETSDFEDYTFTFLTTNQVKATDGTNTSEGTWYVIQDGNEDSESGLTYHIDFTAPESFTGLTEGWGVISATQELIRLQHTNAEDGSIDFLTFAQK